jgi:hypothetical protein
MQDTAQLDLFADAVVSVVAPPPPDLLAEHLVTSGLVHNSYLLELNRAIRFPAMDLPSRLMQWPIEFVMRSRCNGGESLLLLRHPDLADLPFVDAIEEKSGHRPVWKDTDEFGRDRGADFRYFHALDLLTDDHWLDLLRTRNFTDRDGIVYGLKYRAQYGGLSVKNVRSMLAEIGEDEPSDKSAAFIASQCRVTEALQGKFVGWKHNHTSAAEVWATVHGLEAKTFKRDASGHLRFTPGGLVEIAA